MGGVGAGEPSTIVDVREERGRTTRWRVGVRGPTVVVGETGEVALRPKERAVVAALAALHPEAATTSRLIELVWGDDAPSSATKSLHNHVSRVRRSAPGLIAADDRGYRLGARVDIDVAAPGSGPGARPLADLADTTDTDIYRERLRTLAADHDEVALDELATTARTPETVEVLHRAVVEEPYRERRWWLLARAQADAGQRRDALLTLDAARRQLREVGLEPGPPLVELEHSILHGDPTEELPSLRVHVSIHPHRDDPFVGRATELETLARIWQRTRDEARPHVVLVTGPAGIGKTRLVDEFCRRVEVDDHQLRVMWGRHRRDGGRALGALTEAIERAVASEPDVLPSDDALRLLFGSGQPEGDLDSALVRTRLGRALTRLVDRLASRPTVWLFDDAQWASTDSIALLHEALDGATGPLLVVATMRPDRDDGAPTFGEIGRTVGLSEVRLDPFGRDDIGRLVAARLTDQLDDINVDLLHHRTGGLPLYASELTRAAAATGRIDLADVPAAIREWLNHRVSTLDDDLATLLRVASVIGQSVELDVVTEATGRASVDTAAGLDELVARGFLVVDADSSTASFSHALTREIVTDSIGPMARRQTHLAVAEALVTVRPNEHADIARHFDLASDRRAHAHAMIAGSRGLAVGAWTHARDLFRVAVRTADTHAERARALVGLGRAELCAGNATTASDDLLAAVDLARRHDDPIVHARAVLHLVGRAGRGAIGGDDGLRLQLLRAAVDHVVRHEDVDPVLDALHCDLERELAIAMLLTDQHEARNQLLRSAVERAERLDPPDISTHAHALLAYRYARLGPLELPDRLADLDRIAQFPEHRLDPEARIAAQVYRCEDLIRSNRPEDARRALADAGTILSQYPDPYWIWAVRTWDAVLDLIAGDADRADARSAAALAERTSFVEAHICRAVNLVAIRLHQGRGGEVLDVLRSAVDTQPHIPTFRAVLALCAAEAGDDRLAGEQLHWFTDAGVDNLPVDTNRFLGLNVLGHAATRLDDRSAAGVLFPLVEPYDRQWVVLSCFGGGGATWGPVSLTLAGLSATLGHDVSARSYLERAATEARHAPLIGPRIAALAAGLSRSTAER
ncbi:MAG: hypothetical protein CL424_02510 [Acidimicrobiaceae bacterium]|nr:hypothetical protein [Acidimicrobiaceae bacterium]